MGLDQETANSLLLVCIIVVAVLVLFIAIIFGVVCKEIGGRRGFSGAGCFWAGFFFGAVALLIILLRQPKSIAMNPYLTNELMNLAYMNGFGAFSDDEFEREKNTLYYMTDRF